MPRKKIKNSLTLRIFQATFLMLLSACILTYAIIAMTAPVTYTIVVSEELESRSFELVVALEGTDFEDSGALLDAFIRETGCSVMITDAEDRIVRTPSQLAISSILKDDYTVTAMTPSGSDKAVSITVKTPVQASLELFSSGVGTDRNDGTWTVSTSATEWWFAFLDRDEVYCMYISPPIEFSNQTLEILVRLAPWLLAAMLLFSLLCARFYSRWITRPIIRLSEISQRMAELDFSWTCGESRQDEIGILGRNLDELSQRLSTALTELQDANAALQQDIDRERELERQRLAFFSAASHELKTPVTILKGQLAGMLEGVGVYQDRDRYLAKSLQVTGRMEKLVREILTISRMEASGFALNLQPTDLALLVRRQLSLYEDLILQKELCIETSLPETAPFVADAALIQKVLDNLLSNAVFYAPEGARLSAAVISNRGSPVLTIENSGSHIPEDALPHVFEAFCRADASRNRRTGGSGLGLYIVKTILDRHGAACGIENTASGVRFTVRFP